MRGTGVGVCFDARHGASRVRDEGEARSPPLGTVLSKLRAWPQLRHLPSASPLSIFSPSANLHVGLWGCHTPFFPTCGKAEILQPASITNHSSSRRRATSAPLTILPALPGRGRGTEIGKVSLSGGSRWRLMLLHQKIDVFFSASPSLPVALVSRRWPMKSRHRLSSPHPWSISCASLTLSLGDARLVSRLRNWVLLLHIPLLLFVSYPDAIQSRAIFRRMRTVCVSPSQKTVLHISQVANTREDDSSALRVVRLESPSLSLASHHKCPT